MSRECDNNESLLITQQEKKSSLLTFPIKAVVEILSIADKEVNFSFAGNSGLLVLDFTLHQKET